MVVSFNEFMLEPIQVVCPACGWQGIDQDCIRVPNSFVECPKCWIIFNQQMHNLSVVVAH